MQVLNLDGQKDRIRLVNGNLARKSSHHLRARLLLQEVFSTFIILEEVVLPIRKGERLYADFFIPMVKTIIEVHGNQHYHFTLAFHKDKFGFLRSKKRDALKIEFCEVNGLKLIVLPHFETNEEWKIRLK